MAKVLLSIDHGVDDAKRDATKKRVADALGVLEEDVIHIPAGLSVAMIDVPDDMTKAREKKDAHDKHEAEKKAKEEEAAAEHAAKEAAKEAKAAAKEEAKHHHSEA